MRYATILLVIAVVLAMSMCGETEEGGERMTEHAGKKVGVVLSGCGVYDGTEIHEAVITLLALDKAGAETVCIAPNVSQHHVINHLNGEEVEGESRNVLTEAARIARGEVKDIKEVNAADLDALIVPGGFGAAKNLCDFAFKGKDCSVNPEVERLVKEMHAAKKPMGFVCIAPVIAAKVLGGYRPRLTIGTDEATAQAIEAMGGTHVSHKVDEIEVDETQRVVSTPAYMLGPTVSHVAVGIEKLVLKVLELTK